MRKTIYVMFATAATLLVSCGGGASSAVNDAVSAAEQEVQITESPLLGQMPALQLQYNAAKKALDAHYKEQLGNSGNLEDMSKTGNERKEASDELFKIYQSKVTDAVKAIDGKTFAVDVDPKAFTDGKATIIACIDSTSNSITSLYKIKVELTTARDLSMSKASVRDANDAELTSLAWYASDVKGITEDDMTGSWGIKNTIKSGVTFYIEINGVSIRNENAMKFAKLYFTSNDL